jgi:putative ABC transport system ATP-binding protein
MAAIERVGTAHLARENALSLSGGEQQRIVFARALVKEPDIIFADEPFSNLDEETASPLIELLHEMHVAGKTIFLVTHSYENRIRSTRAITIENGAVVEL